jgi:PIN domain nuclease of toxin-antitoxin system
MTSVLADTQSIIWYLLDQSKLSPAALQALRTAEQTGRLFVSAITLVEIRLEVEAGTLPQSVSDGLREAMTNPRRRLTVLPVDVSVVDALGQVVPTNHRGTSERIIAATAVAHELQVVAAETSAAPGGSVTTLDAAVNVAEREAILAALNQYDQHRERAAQALGISVRTLHYKLNRLAP